LPHPFPARDRAAGYRYQLSILQAEFSLTQVLDQPVMGRIFFEEVIRENLDLGRPSQVSLIFDRKINRRTPGRFRTREAVSDCRSAGIRVVMITGDYPATARAIAHLAGLDDGSIVLSGETMDKLGERDLQKRARTATVFARIMPEQKLRIVQALKADNNIVAMT
jgi:high-affinity K+ transport system ATPase subunit B